MESAQKTSDPAFKIAKVNLSTGETTIVIQKGILGGLANQLKGTSEKRKGYTIIRKLGHLLSSCGDLQYDKSTDEPGIDPEIIVSNR